MRDKVLLVQAIHQSGVDVLSADYDVRLAEDTRVDTLIREARDANGLIVRTAPLPAQVIEAAPKLRVIARHGVGVDNIDVEAATRLGIPVVNTPYANTVSVAEHTLGFLIVLAKRLVQSDRAVRSGDWQTRNSYEAIDLDGKTLGIVGTGRIGMLVACKASAALGMRLVGYDPFVAEETMALRGLRKCNTLDDLLSEADLVTIHAPSTPHTRGLIDRQRLQRMKHGSYLVNVARGGLVDECALADLVRSGHLAGAAVDVLDTEPPDMTNPLLLVENIIVTPHMAALTRECAVRMSVGAAEQVRDVLRGGKPKYLVNPGVTPRG